jgi:hypothetical protein
MDIGPGIHLNGWRKRICRMKEAKTDVAFRG